MKVSMIGGFVLAVGAGFLASAQEVPRQYTFSWPLGEDAVHILEMRFVQEDG